VSRAHATLAPLSTAASPISSALSRSPDATVHEPAQTAPFAPEAYGRRNVARPTASAVASALRENRRPAFVRTDTVARTGAPGDAPLTSIRAPGTAPKSFSARPRRELVVRHARLGGRQVSRDRRRDDENQGARQGGGRGRSAPSGSDRGAERRQRDGGADRERHRGVEPEAVRLEREAHEYRRPDAEEDGLRALFWLVSPAPRQQDGCAEGREPDEPEPAERVAQIVCERAPPAADEGQVLLDDPVPRRPASGCAERLQDAVPERRGRREQRGRRCGGRDEDLDEPARRPGRRHASSRGEHEAAEPSHAGAHGKVQPPGPAHAEAEQRARSAERRDRERQERGASAGAREERRGSAARDGVVAGSDQVPDRRERRRDDEEQRAPRPRPRGEGDERRHRRRGRAELQAVRRPDRDPEREEHRRREEDLGRMLVARPNTVYSACAGRTARIAAASHPPPAPRRRASAAATRREPSPRSTGRTEAARARLSRSGAGAAIRARPAIATSNAGGHGTSAPSGQLSAGSRHGSAGVPWSIRSARSTW